MSQLFGNLFQCNSHSKSDNIPVTPQKCPSSAGFHIQENEESHYEVCNISIETLFIQAIFSLQVIFKYSELTITFSFFCIVFILIFLRKLLNIGENIQQCKCPLNHLYYKVIAFKGKY